MSSLSTGTEVSVPSQLVNIVEARGQKSDGLGRTTSEESALTMSVMSGGAWGAPSSSSKRNPQSTRTSNMALLRGTAVSEEERSRLGVRGLLPPAVSSLKLQAARVLKQLRACSTQLDRYTLLSDLEHDNQTLFYHVVSSNIRECMPIIYTPTVGEACKKFGHIMKHPKGMYLSINDKGNVASILCNWPRSSVKVIVMTDGERILGLGDLGTYGMGIPLGKLNLYTIAAGIHPENCLPLCIDVGTDNSELLHDEFYTGLRHQRVRGPTYDEFLDEIMESMSARWPTAVIHFEDFGNRTAFNLLNKYRRTYTTFNDDIQGTAGVALAGFFSCLRAKHASLADEIMLFYGAGEAGCGFADLIVEEMVSQGIQEERARSKIFLVDSKGLITCTRASLPEHKRKYAKACPDSSALLRPGVTLLEIIQEIQPTALIGVSAQAKAFTAEVLTEMAKINRRPIIFALSNPTDKSECTAEEAVKHTDGRVLFCSGSPFEGFMYDGRVFEPAQGNNTYIFPGLGLGVIASGARLVNNEMFRVAARTLCQMVSDADLDKGSLFPPFEEIRSISLCIAVACAQYAWDNNIANYSRPTDVEAYIADLMYVPLYKTLA